jgi:hypothetical protein
MDLQDVSGRLRKLSPQQEKVIRLYFGLGCERPALPDPAHVSGILNCERRNEPAKSSLTGTR